tara:strand:- start:283 stop:459 length:177 start_codon:yes stop_codon:yes gene_type:complete
MGGLSLSCNVSMTALVALFTLRLYDLQAKSHDKKVPVFIFWERPLYALRPLTSFFFKK